MSLNQVATYIHFTALTCKHYKCWSAMHCFDKVASWYSQLQATAYDEADSVVVIVTITNSSNSWSISIPKTSSTTTEASCMAEPDFCPLSTSPMCSSFAEQHENLLTFFLADSTSPYNYNNIQSNNSCTPGSYTGKWR